MAQAAENGDILNERVLIGIGGAARHINRDVSTTRGHVIDMYVDRVPGIWRIDNGAFVMSREGLASLERRVKQRANRRRVA